MFTKTPMARYSTKEAIEIYEALGALTANEVPELKELTPKRRMQFFVNIYGYAAAQVAESRYQELCKQQ